MSDFRMLTFPELCDRLTGRQNALVLFHARPDGDAVGSAFALKSLLAAQGCEVYCKCADAIPARLRFMAKDDIIPGGFAPEFVVAVDTASPSQLGELKDKYNIDLMVDHHASGSVYADNFVRADASATGEIIFDISRELVKRNIIAAIPEGTDSLIYAAISSDTGCFKFPNATPRTHRIAAELLECGVASGDINHRLFEIKTPAQLRAESAAIGKMRFFCDGRIAAVGFEPEEIEALGVPDEQLDILIDIARSVDGADVAVTARRMAGDKSYRVSMRSSGDVNVAAVCEHFGGGGHIRAAGCSVSATYVGEALTIIASETEKQMVANLTERNS